MRLLRLTKLVQLLRKSKTFEYIESRRAINYSLVQLYVFLFGLFYLTHFLACGWCVHNHPHPPPTHAQDIASLVHV